jgi:hypothetical protein
MLWIGAFATPAQSDICSGVGFELPPSFATGTNVYSFITADLNGDSIEDVVAPRNLNYDRGTISILFGDGVGGYGPPRSVESPVGVAKVAAGDINGDGRHDLVGGLYLNQLRVWINEGDGVFSAPVLLTNHGTLLEGLADIRIADFNGDQKNDVVALAETKVYILPGNGNGTFSAPTSTNWIGSNAHLAVGDLNGDGSSDVAMTRTGGSYPWELGVILGSANGNVAISSRHELVGSPTGLLISDIDRNGANDIIVPATNYYQPPTVSDPYFVQPWFGGGNGSFSAGPRLPFPRAPQGAAVGDFNGDSRIDIAANLGVAIAIRNGAANGAFQSPEFYMSTGPTAIAAGDANRDSIRDLMILRGGGESSVSVFSGGATGLDAPKSKLGGGNLNASADMDSDGRADLVSAYRSSFPYSAEVTVALTSVDGNLLQDQVVETLNGLESLDVGDFNGDGVKDIVTAHSNNQANKIGIHYGSGSGVLGTATPVTWSSNVKNVTVGDFNSDGRDDLFITDDTPKGIVLMNQGNGTFARVEGFVIHGIAFWIRSPKGDFNSDQKMDLVVLTGTTLSIWLGNGDGSFILGGSSTNGYLDYFVSGDLNGDGNLDVVGFRPTDGLIRYFGDGQGGIQAVAPQPITASQTHSLMAADFNGDGSIDVALGGDNIYGNLMIIASRPEAPYYAQIAYLSIGGLAAGWPNGIPSLTAKDFNADGSLDISYTTGAARGIILNESGRKPCMTVSDITLTEPDTGTASAVFTVNLSRPSTEVVRANFSIVQGTAGFGTDVSDVAARFEIPAGQTSVQLIVPIIGDIIDEFDEEFNFKLAGASNATVGRREARGTIVDNDPEPTLSINDRTASEGNMGTQMVFDVTLSAPSAKVITLRYVSADGTAVVNSDYNPANALCYIQPGATTGSFAVYSIGDNMFERDEEFFINLSEPSNVNLPDTLAKATILNDDPVPTINASAISVTEPDSGTVSHAISIRLTNPSYLPVTANVLTSDGTATGGLDYVAADVPVTIAPGETLATPSFSVLGDTVDEVNEIFYLNIYNQVNAVVTVTQTPFVILDNDPIPAFSLENTAIFEGNSGNSIVNVPVRLQNPSGRNVSVNYMTEDGTAVSASDYSPTSGTISFAVGETLKYIPVTIYGDTIPENDENFLIRFSSPVNGTLAQTVANVTIRNDEFVPLTISGRVTTPNGAGVRNATVNLVDSFGTRRTATSSSFGLYSFANLRPGDTYTISVSSKRYRFTPIVLQPVGDVANADFTGLE